MNPAFRKILVAADGSPESRAAVSAAIDVARDLGAAVAFLYVYLPENRRFGDVLRGEGITVITEALDEARAAGVEGAGAVTEGDPVAEIVRVAREEHADLIVVGSRGVTTLSSLVFGSVSRAVTRRSERSVLVVKNTRCDQVPPARSHRSEGAGPPDEAPGPARSLELLGRAKTRRRARSGALSD